MDVELGIVLIVDDAPASATALELACEGLAGIDVNVVASAPEAVRLLEREDREVCAVITDVRMPDMDGFQLVTYLRGHVRHSHTPVIVVTGDTDPETPERMARLGANAFFSKPFSPGAVRQTLERLLHEKHTPKHA